MVIKNINIFSGYTITDEGVVTRVHDTKVAKPWLAKVGYYYVDLILNGKKKKVALHRLLAEAFIPNPENKRTVNHKDGNKLNNDLSNLEWATDSENIQHAYDTQLNKGRIKIPLDKYSEIYKKFKEGINLSEIVLDYGISPATCTLQLTRYAKNNGLYEEFTRIKYEQKLIRAKTAGKNKANKMTLLMIDKDKPVLLNTFITYREAKDYLNKKSSGAISNAVSGRCKLGYGYRWVKLSNNATVEQITEIMEKINE